MVKETNVKFLEGDEKSLYKVQKIRLGSKSFITPTKAVDVRHLRPDVTPNSKVRGLNELFKRLTPEKLDTLISDPAEQHKFNLDMSRLRRKTNSEEESTLCFMEYEADKYPTHQELQFMMDTAYDYSDMTPLPIISKIEGQKIEDKDFERYKNHLKESIEIIEQLNHQPIMGIIPNMAFKYVPDLVEFYIDQGINSFYVNINGKNPISMSQTIRNVLRKLNSLGKLNESFTYAINSNAGRAGKDATVIDAKDILGFSVGFNALGEMHKVIKRPAFVYQQMKDTSQNKFRLFNKKDYGYYKAVDLKDLSSFLPKDTNVPAHMFKTRPTLKSTLQKVFNMEQQALEAMNLRTVIKEEQTPLPYLGKKEHVNKEDVKKIEKLTTQVFKKKHKKK